MSLFDFLRGRSALEQPLQNAAEAELREKEEAKKEAKKNANTQVALLGYGLYYDPNVHKVLEENKQLKEAWENCSVDDSEQIRSLRKKTKVEVMLYLKGTANRSDKKKVKKKEQGKKVGKSKDLVVTVVTKRQVEVSNRALNAVKELIADARERGFIVGAMVDEVEIFLYGNVVWDILSNLLDSKQKKYLYKEFGIDDKDITRVRNDKRLKPFLRKNAPITANDYDKFKVVSRKISSRISALINSFEKAIQLKACEKELRELRKDVLTADDVADRMAGSIEVGFDRGDGDFESLGDAEFNYFNKYSDRQLDMIYKADPQCRDVIKRVRKRRKR